MGKTGTGKTTLLQTYVLAKIRNELDVDWDTVACAREDAAREVAVSSAGSGLAGGAGHSSASGVWHCRASAVMRIEPLAGDPVSDPKLTKHLAIRASFVEVAVTPNSIDGLLVDFWDAQLAGAETTKKEKT